MKRSILLVVVLVRTGRPGVSAAVAGGVLHEDSADEHPAAVKFRGTLTCTAYDPPRLTWKEPGSHPVHSCILRAPSEPNGIRLRNVERLWNVALELDGGAADFVLWNHSLANTGGSPTQSEHSQRENFEEQEDGDRGLTELAAMVGIPRATLKANSYEVLTWIPVKGRKRRTILSGARYFSSFNSRVVFFVFFCFDRARPHYINERFADKSFL